MIDQIRAYAWKIVRYRNPDRLKVRGRADARHLEKLRRVDSAAANDHLAARLRRA